MIYSSTLHKEIEKWWRKLDKIMSVAESLDDICIGRKYISYNKVRCHCSC